MIHKSGFLCLCLWFARGVFGVDADEVKSVSVMEGDSVTLHTNLTDIQKRDQVLWMFGPEETRVAEIHKKSIDMYDSNEKFGDRLKLDSQTGSLNITNTRITDSGLYKLQIISDRGNSDKKFNVTVYAQLSVPVIIRDSSQCSSSSERSSVSKCVLLCSAIDVTHVSLSWYKGNSLLSNISVSDLNIRLSLPLEVEYQDTNTYICVVSNPVSIQTRHLNVSDICQTCSEKNDFPVVIAVVIAILIVIAAVVVAVAVYLHRKKSCPATPEFQIHEEVLYAETTFCARRVKSSKGDEEDHVVYSSVLKR
ncbi:SLAM family member 9-like isoform X2 [Triplophysa dalaica]|uniref:SLAM family member 9-like isoform X2 n=1 Tax=Triplophysa dalaica TaxID=1582913 RepID=UPI0024E03080|nr:SLAM family member 9-like isoform X2 [Triplophysa dalaica]XP_056614325.1 SLAM family member 9-like isoform X2 [Triplophysa dalaica]